MSLHAVDPNENLNTGLAGPVVADEHVYSGQRTGVYRIPLTGGTRELVAETSDTAVLLGDARYLVIQTREDAEQSLIRISCL